MATNIHIQNTQHRANKTLEQPRLRTHRSSIPPSNKEAIPFNPDANLQLLNKTAKYSHTTTTTTVLRPFFRDHPGELVPEENFWTLWCKGRLTEADTHTIQMGTTKSGQTSAHLHHPPKQQNINRY